jgi:imidazole glycerol-phosphate synthase
VQADRPFLGVCLGLQLLFDGGDENGGVAGLGVIPGRVGEFDRSKGMPVPHIGWNNLVQQRPSRLLSTVAPEERVYYVHSYRAMPSEENREWVLATGKYGEEFVSVVQKGSVHACQFHPEKSGAIGQEILRNFLDLERLEEPDTLRRAGDGARQQACPHVLRLAWRSRHMAFATSTRSAA